MLQRAIELKPDLANAHYNLYLVLKRRLNKETTMRATSYVILWAVIVLLEGSMLMAAENGRKGVKTAPGRRVKVSAICIGFGGRYEQKLKLAIDHLQTAGKAGVDIACLPEEFAGTKAETIPGPTTKAIAALAKKYNMYVICPIREQADDEKYNTAVLIDRGGKVIGRYRKVFVYWGEKLRPSREGVKVFDTDFGRISILTCFDANFSELWHQADLQGAEIVFWPSAYGGGLPLNAYAMVHNYYVVPVGEGNIIGITGNTLQDVQKPRDRQFITTLDLDRTLIHTNFNGEKVKRLLAEHKGEVEQEQFFRMESWYLLRATKPGVRVRDLCKKYGIETLRQYRHRSRRQINRARRKKKDV